MTRTCPTCARLLTRFSCNCSREITVMEAGASLMSCSNPEADTTTSDKVVAVAVAVVAASCARPHRGAHQCSSQGHPGALALSGGPPSLSLQDSHCHIKNFLSPTAGFEMKKSEKPNKSPRLLVGPSCNRA